MMSYIRLNIKRYWRILAVIAALIFVIGLKNETDGMAEYTRNINLMKAVSNIKSQNRDEWNDIIQRAVGSRNPEMTLVMEYEMFKKNHSEEIEAEMNRLIYEKNKITEADLKRMRKDIIEAKTVADMPDKPGEIVVEEGFSGCEKSYRYQELFKYEIMKSVFIDNEDYMKKLKSGDYWNSGADYELEMGELRVSLLSAYSPAFYGTVLLMINVFAAAAALIGGGLENMRRYKMFEESLPISKRRKYIGKLLSNMIMSGVFAAFAFGAFFTVHAVSPISEVVNWGDMGYILFSTAVMTVSAAGIYTLVGSICGNIISCAAAELLAFTGLHGLVATAEATHNIFRKGSFGIFNWGGDDTLMGRISDAVYECDWMSMYSMIFKDFEKSVSDNIIFLVISLVVSAGIGLLLADRLNVERCGRLFMNRGVSAVYYVLAVIMTNILVVYAILIQEPMLENHVLNRVLPYIVYAVSTLISAVLYRFLFRIKIRV